MRRLFLIAALIALTVPVSAATTYNNQNTATSEYGYGVPDRVGRGDLGINVAGAFSDDNDQFDDAVAVGGTFAYGLTPWFAIGVEGGWQERELVSDADLEAFPLLADLIIRLPNSSTLVPYVIGGAGVIFFDTDASGSGVNIDSDEAFALKGGAGVDIFLNEHWILNTEASYVWVEDTFDNTFGNDEPEFSYWTVGVGLKYLF